MTQSDDPKKKERSEGPHHSPVFPRCVDFLDRSTDHVASPLRIRARAPNETRRSTPTVPRLLSGKCGYWKGKEWTRGDTRPACAPLAW